jgi:hypothetical protein
MYKSWTFICQSLQSQFQAFLLLPHLHLLPKLLLPLVVLKHLLPKLLLPKLLLHLLHLHLLHLHLLYLLLLPQKVPNRNVAPEVVAMVAIAVFPLNCPQWSPA